MMQTTWVYDTTALDYLIANYGLAAELAVKKTADSIAKDIREHWSSESPSSPGNAPAVVTGTLDKSVRLLRRGSGGRFATIADAKYWTIRIGAPYAAALEFGFAPRNLAPRPFFRPAMLRAQNLLTKNLQEATGKTIGLSIGSLKLYGNGIDFPQSSEEDLG